MRTCKGCGTEFEPQHSLRIYCCDPCRIYSKAINGRYPCFLCKTERGSETVDEFITEHRGCLRRHFDEVGRDWETTPKKRKPSRKREHSQHRQIVLERDNYICQLCGGAVNPNAHPLSDEYPTLDHDIPVFYGGDDSPENLRTSHRWCNQQKGPDDTGFRMLLMNPEATKKREWLQSLTAEDFTKET